ncbi:hypothetical protein BDR04DRAFT_667970 [Suillus decipiens]|nr:hypothetical protein BDR04DRAFT_667970 [Suillus decipiens]
MKSHVLAVTQILTTPKKMELSHDPLLSRPTADQQARLRSGMLTIRIFSGKATVRPLNSTILNTLMLYTGRGLSSAPGAHVPEAIQKAFDNSPA